MLFYIPNERINESSIFGLSSNLQQQLNGIPLTLDVFNHKTKTFSEIKSLMNHRFMSTLQRCPNAIASLKITAAYLIY